MQDIQTILEIWRPGLSLVPRTADIIDPPFNTTISTRRDKKRVFNDTHGLESRLENVRWAITGVVSCQENCKGDGIIRTVCWDVFLGRDPRNFIQIAAVSTNEDKFQ